MPKKKMFDRRCIKLSQPSFFSISISKLYIFISSLLRSNEPSRFNSSMQAFEMASTAACYSLVLELWTLD
jgi:hypothetical protein